MFQLGQIGETAYDLKFSLFGIPVRVHPGFWILGCLLGWTEGRLDLVFIWLVCLFASILIHEFGHALSARHFGWPPRVMLYHFGGLAVFQPGWGYTRGRAMWISFAGPLAGFAFCALVVAVDFAVTRNSTGEQPWLPMLLQRLVYGVRIETNLQYTLLQLEFINLLWGLFNLLPVYPLDGGQICFEYMNGRSSTAGRRRTHQVGMVAAALGALFFLSINAFIGGLMFAGLAYENYRNAEQLKRGHW